MNRNVLTAAEQQIGAVALLVLAASVLIAATMSPGTLDRQAVLAGAEVPIHHVIDLDEQADGRLVTAHVVVEATPDAEGLIAVSAAVVERLRDEPGYSGLRINLYDDEVYRSFGPTLGQALDAPNGEWTQALRTTRDYRLHRTVIEVKDKDWDQRPDARHVEMATAWQEQERIALAGGSETSQVMTNGESDERVAPGPNEEDELHEALERLYGWLAVGEAVEVVLD